MAITFCCATALFVALACCVKDGGGMAPAPGGAECIHERGKGVDLRICVSAGNLQICSATEGCINAPLPVQR